MNTLEFRLPPAEFTQFLTSTHASPQPSLPVAADTLAMVGHHLLLQEFDGPSCFTGQWIRTRILDAHPANGQLVLTLSVIARNTPANVRRRAA